MWKYGLSESEIARKSFVSEKISIFSEIIHFLKNIHFSDKIHFQKKNLDSHNADGGQDFEVAYTNLSATKN